MMTFRGPVELALTTGLRRAARLKPGDFDRLGEHRSSAFLIAPDDLPVAFRIEPSVRQVRVVRRTRTGACAVRIHGPLIDLLGLFEGTLDADAAFFSRTLRVEGDTRAVVALHNALEAADLTLADMIGVPFGGALAGAALRAALRWPRRPARVYA